MEPIVLNEFGETLIPPSDATETSFLGRTAECVRLGRGVIGTLGMYGDQAKVYMDVADPQENYWAIYCPTRALRERVPHRINTYGELRQWCAEEIIRQRNRRVLLETLVREEIPALKREIQQLVDEHAVYGECEAPEAAAQRAAEDKAAEELAKIGGIVMDNQEINTGLAPLPKLVRRRDLFPELDIIRNEVPLDGPLDNDEIDED